MKILSLLLILSAQNSYATDSCWQKWDSNFERVSGKYLQLAGSCDEPLKAELLQITKNNHIPISYSSAKRAMYNDIDVNPEVGAACSVYSPKECRGRRAINCEHTWPKSLGAKAMPAVGDLHHLYPAAMDINSKRSHHPFCDVEKVFWKRAESKLGLSANPKFPKCFEPPQAHKGNVARSLFYFAVRYQMPIRDYEEETLRRWHVQDPVDANESARNDKIMEYQNNRNPFVDQPYLVDLISDF